MSKFKKHQFEITISDIRHGYGTGEYEDREVLVKNTIPGDIVKVWPYKIKKSYIKAKIDEHIKKSDLRSESDCPHFPKCGGCAWRNIPYNRQLQLKEQIIRNEIKSQNLLAEPQKIIPAPDKLYYRNKMELTFGEDQGNVILGMHKRGDFASIVNTHSCLLQSKQTNSIHKIILNWANTYNVSPYIPQTHQGVLRHLLIKEGKNTGQIIIALVTTTYELPFLNELVNELTDQIKGLAGIVLVKNNNVADTITFESEKLIWGNDFIEENINSKEYRVSLKSFFQTNTSATEFLYEYIKKITNQNQFHSILDLYCGTGSIGIYIADKTHKITGIDINADCIANAEENKRINNLDNIQYHTSDVKEYLKKNSHINSSDLAIIDPPRGGLHPKSRNILTTLPVKYMVYVSCNPHTLCMDLKELEKSYQILSIQPFDLFPYTPHQENVVILKKIHTH